MDEKTKDNMTDLAEVVEETSSNEPAPEASNGQVTDSDGNIVTLGN